MDASGAPTPRQKARIPSALYASFTVCPNPVLYDCIRDLVKSSGNAANVLSREALAALISVRRRLARRVTLREGW